MYPGRTLHAGKDRLLHSTPPSRTLISGNSLADATEPNARLWKRARGRLQK